MGNHALFYRVIVESHLSFITGSRSNPQIMLKFLRSNLGLNRSLSHVALLSFLKRPFQKIVLKEIPCLHTRGFALAPSTFCATSRKGVACRCDLLRKPVPYRSEPRTMLLKTWKETGWSQTFLS